MLFAYATNGYAQNMVRGVVTDVTGDPLPGVSVVVKGTTTGTTVSYTHLDVYKRQGVDNDDLICNISDPPISSIELEVERGGYSIGRLIHQQIKKEHEGTFNIVINPIRIELRQSTEKHNIKDPYILEVVKYIESHYNSDLTIELSLIHI